MSELFSMSLLAATQLPKPADEQAFERASVVLWRSLLADPAVQLNGRRGQGQDGVDLFGIRSGDTDWHVGIQCKLKSEGKVLSEKEVRGEVQKALTFEPPLKEYYVTTTAPDDAAMQKLARKITSELAATGRTMRVFVWGWNTLEARISEDGAARKAFDPTYMLFSEDILAGTQSISVGQREMHDDLKVGFSQMMATLAEMSGRLANPPGDSTVEMTLGEAFLDAEIDGYRDLNDSGRTLIAMPLLERLLARVVASASGRILFRIKANIGYCLLALGKDAEAAAMLLAAYDHAPNEPKAIANKACGLLLQGDWEEVLGFGKAKLEADPSNEWLAGYLVQAAGFDMSIANPLELIPEPLHRTVAVQIGWVEFVRRRGEIGEWWKLAHAALAMHPAESHLIRLVAVADLDEVLTSPRFQHTRVLSFSERQKLQAATETLTPQWNHERGLGSSLRPAGVALCCNLVMCLAALEEFSHALEIARQGLALAPDDAALLLRATLVAVESGDDAFAGELLPKLPASAEAFVLKFRFHASRADWLEVIELFNEGASLIPSSEEPIISITAKLAAIRVGENEPAERRRQVLVIAEDAARDPRANIVVAEFARQENMEDIADTAFKAALKLIDEDSYAADRFMVAHHANRRGDAAIVVDLLDGRVAEDLDSNELRMLAGSFINDGPIRQRALAFFTRLPEAIAELPYYLHAAGLMHFNRGALREAESALRKAAAAEANLDSYIALFSALDRLDRLEEVKTLIDSVDWYKVKGTPGQKMLLAQMMRKIGRGPKALEYAYRVLEAARNDQKVALSYVGLIMMDPDEGLIPPAQIIAVDMWVQLENDRGERHAFLIEEGSNRPADNVLNPAHPMAARAFGLRIGDEFEMPVAIGGTRRWRIVEIKHKYLHALHDVMENFENRFPDANGLYKMTMKEGDIQPFLEQIRLLAERDRKHVDLYLKHNFPISFVTAKGERNTINLIEYVRFLGFDLRTCLGTEPERLAARELLQAHKKNGAVLDAYAAWTVSTMGAFDVLQSVLGALSIPRTVIDEIKMLRDKEEATPEGSMTMTEHNGRYIRQEHTAEDISIRRGYIVEQLARIEAACDVRPVIAPDKPTDVAVRISQAFGDHVLNAANLVGTEHLLVSEDMHYRQFAEAACGAKGVWLQAIFSFAHENGLIDDRRYVDFVIKLAWRRHGHLTLSSDVMRAVLYSDDKQGLEDFKVVANFIGTRNADIQSHINVAILFLNQIWRASGHFDLRRMKATSILLEHLIRFRMEDWALVLAFIKRSSSPILQQYIDGWILGHFFSAQEVANAGMLIEKAAQ